MPNFGKRPQFCIYTPPEIRNLYGEPDWYDDDNYYCLPIGPEAITPADTFLGEVGLVPTFRRLYYQGPRTVIRGYEFNLPEAWMSVFYLLEHLASLNAGIPYQPLLIKDYVRPERADYAAAIANDTTPFTQRQGVLHSLVPSAGSGGGYWASGFAFKFQEQTARPV